MKTKDENSYFQHKLVFGDHNNEVAVDRHGRIRHVLELSDADRELLGGKELQIARAALIEILAIAEDNYDGGPPRGPNEHIWSLAASALRSVGQK